MSNFRLFKERLSTKFEEISGSLSKLSKNWTDLLDKITGFGKSIGTKFTEVSEKFEDFFESVQSKPAEALAIEEGLKIKQLMDGEMTFQQVDTFTKTLWENHELAQQAFEDTSDQKYYEMAMEIKLVIQELEQLKEYLELHGKY